MEVTEQQSASAKLGRDEALALARAASRVVVAKGRKIVEFDMRSEPSDEDLLAALLGPTGNLRAPAIRQGKTLIVGFNEDLYEQHLG